MRSCDWKANDVVQAASKQLSYSHIPQSCIFSFPLHLLLLEILKNVEIELAADEDYLTQFFHHPSIIYRERKGRKRKETL